jgi:hypothetical protein
VAALKLKIRVVPLAILIAVIAGCGGGGGGGSTEPPPPTTNRTPVIEAIGDLRIVENEMGVTTVSASDPDGDTLTFSLSGADADSFELSEQTVSFVTPPDFENPADSDSNNQYTLSVSVSDGQASSSTSLEVNIVDAHEGRVVDSPVAGALVFVDENDDVERSDDEREGITDEAGYFSVERADSDGNVKLVSIGGTDSSTNNSIFGLYRSDVLADASKAQVITGISTLIASVDAASDKAALASAIGFDDGVDALLASDIWSDSQSGSDEARSLQRVNSQVTLILEISGAIASEFSASNGVYVSAAEVLAEKLLNTSNSPSTIMLLSEQEIAALFQEVLEAQALGASVSQEAISAIASSIADLMRCLGMV